ncbi:flagellar biosynthesis regulator FlaF [Pseudoroseomonas cervicalis]|uniref:flagellar biosynthesis regulator FlaF n=1 Tax=Teichococcus cervicalis TaxID=204525 RepID=UPI002783558E|nr:flagellar biosynthesis regulator FlaF [Pseudoroseomonas cervicalis]MDQ1081103.1 flagellar biosynthesis regulator FlaF [Pseudoroseomonas cervicalis]
MSHIAATFAPASAPASVLAALPTALALGTPREEEAAAFRSVAATLLAARDAGHEARACALRLNRRLWQAVLIALAAPENTLPVALRQSLAGLGCTMLREMDRNRPDLAFLAGINQEIASGLAACQ